MHTIPYLPSADIDHDGCNRTICREMFQCLILQTSSLILSLTWNWLECPSVDIIHYLTTMYIIAQLTWWHRHPFRTMLFDVYIQLSTALTLRICISSDF